MNESIDAEIPAGKVYKDKAFWTGTFLGGPLVAGYMFAENFKALGQDSKVKSTWIITILSTLAIFGIVISIPENINLPNQVVPIAYSAVAYGLFTKLQGEKVTQHMEKGGSVKSWWNVILIGIIGLIVTMTPFATYVLASDATTSKPTNITTKAYGNTVQHEIDFDPSNVSEQEIDEIADQFRATGFFDISVAKYVYVLKNGKTYELYTSVVSGTENNPEDLQPFIELRDQMDQSLPKMEVEIKLVVDYLDNVVKVLKRQ